MSISVTVRLPESLVGYLDEVAQESKRSRAFYVKEALEEYLQDKIDARIALDRRNHPKSKYLSSKELLEELEKEN